MVWPWANSVPGAPQKERATLSETMAAASGAYPLLIPFPQHRMSGVTSKVFAANRCPVRP